MDNNFDYNSHIDMMRIEPDQAFPASYVTKEGIAKHVVIQGKPGCYFVKFTEEDEDTLTEDNLDIIIDYAGREWIERGKGKTEDSEAIGKIIERTFQ